MKGKKVYYRAQIISAKGKYLSHDHHHSHEYQWIQVLSGILHVKTEFGYWITPPQKAVWIPININHQVYCPVESKILSIYFHQSLIKNIEKLQHCFVFFVDQLLSLLAQYFLENYSQNNFNHLNHMVPFLLDLIKQTPIIPLYLPSAVDPRLKKMLKLLTSDNNGLKQRTFEELSKKCGALFAP